ncbi:hypothetical protein BCF33_0477 [Hasllibacter halocynthiae]|uniref:Apolipoprotein acyltransferase n=1 Tax=Hasllibacter halocynthiae TaxID=595589 RepID=A0A2T0X7K0_9RHOB|nr:hypothetical protein [Hasllibacter halocynthiae]PRY94875.1 hypothetical protein BCF33_0477 [Hasllibacter halocynthiae]
MPLFVLGFVIGGFLGARKAKALGGKAADMAQYAAGYGIAFGLVGFLVAVVVTRLSS